jgi:hypothetical protein
MRDFFRKILRPPPANRGERVVDEIIASSKKLGAKSAREAAEMTMGRALTEKEWGSLSKTWQRRWY